MRANLSILATACVLTACGGGHDGSDQPPSQATFVVATDPNALSMKTGASTQLAAQASETGLPAGAGSPIFIAVDWALQESNGGALSAASSVGETFTITYTAPANAGVYHVVASDRANSGVRSIITITVE
jgi:hypothetical protein